MIQNSSTEATRSEPVDRERLVRAIAKANLPSLIPALVQLTGDLRWLGDDYQTTLTPGFERHDDGGLTPERQEEVRSAAVEAVLAHLAGTPASYPAPDRNLMTRLMSVSMGEQVPAELADLAAYQLRLAPAPDVDLTSALSRRPDFEVIIVGAGFSGLALAVRLGQLGIPYRVYERNSEPGGTWFENRYPGARVDIPSDLYSLSFFPRNWTETFAQRDEIHGYVNDVVEHFELAEHIETQTSVDAMRWDEEGRQWVVAITGPDGAEREVRATAVVTAAGLHNTPNIPAFPGLEQFTGQVVHSARWDRDLDVTDKRVAVIGSGASAMQLAVAITDRVSEMTIVQVEPQWIAPNEHYFSAAREEDHWLFDHVPFYRGWHRFRLYFQYTERTYAALPVDPDAAAKNKQVSSFNDAFRRFFTHYLSAQLEGRPDLIEKSLPAYPPFGKRLLLDNGWFGMLRQPHVSLISTGIQRFEGNVMVTADGGRHEIDVLILCTGFQQQRFLFPMEILGREGQDLRAGWEDDNGRAHLGITTPNFPNLFFLYGPNTNPPGGSYLTIAEAQVNYISDLLATMLRSDLDVVECRAEPYVRYNEALDAENSRMVYAQDGVSNYYRNKKGRVVTNSPWPVARYFELTSSANLDDFDVTPHSASARDDDAPCADHEPEPVGHRMIR